MNAAVTKGYDDDHASINLPNDIQNLERITALIEQKQQLTPKYLIVVGIGGSNLGTLAVQEAILGKLYNQTYPDLKVLYADTVDDDVIKQIISIIEPGLKKGENVLINGVSKSGGTTETIANFEVLVKVLKKWKKQYAQYVIVTSDKDSNFWNYAQDKDISVLEIPKKVGGRFSVFSSVGLFPLGMLGIDITQLLHGAQTMKKKCLSSNLYQNPAALSASLIYQHYLNGKNIHDLFLFCTDLESLGKWYRQLMGESIGKEFNTTMNQVFEGITPTVSIGSTDLHSMAQLYLGGPYDKFTTFVRIDKNKDTVTVPIQPQDAELVQGIKGKSLHKIMNAILSGVQRAFIKGKRPFVEIVLPDKSAYSIGQFMQFKEMEIMYLGYLLGVNPFDQPNVESYKIETKKILEEQK
jgi:glucose-6-phosphate isomerase